MIRILALVACVLTVCITASSAFIRHSQAGVGCEQWPVCYRDAVASRTGSSPSSVPLQESVNRSAQATPDASPVVPRSVRIARALHRVSAMTVGVLVLVIAVFGWSSMRDATRMAVAVALAVTLFLAWLGRLTPHPLPLVTIGNLIGGLALAAAFAWIAAARPAQVLILGREQPVARDAQRATAPVDGAREGRSGFAGSAAPLAWVALALLAASAWVGTMIGAHGAIDACAAPLCLEGAHLDIAALDPMRPAAPLEPGAARGLHVTHRLLVAAFALAALVAAWRIRRRPAVSISLVAATLAQWLLGVGTALGTQPLFTTTAHNALAALLTVLLAGIASGSMHGRRVPLPLVAA